MSAQLSAADIGEGLLRDLSVKVPDNIDDYADPDDVKHVKDAADFVDDVIESMQAPPEKRGAPMPWYKTKDEIQFKPGGLSIWSGDSGLGKSAMLMQCMCGLTYREKALIISPEMPVVDTLSRAAMQLCGNSKPAPDFARATLMKLRGRMFLFDQTGDLEDKRVLGVIRWAREQFGITQFVIDSLMMIEMTAIQGDYNRAEGRFVKRLKQFARDEGVHAHLVAHQRKGNGHNRKDKDDVEGSGKITKAANNVFFLEADDKKAAEMEKPPREQNPEVMKRPNLYLMVKKMRDAPKPNGSFPFWIHPSFQFLDNSMGRPMNILGRQ